MIEFEYPDKPIAIWNSENPESIYLTRNATEREKELQKRIASHNFIVCSKLVLVSKFVQGKLKQEYLGPVEQSKFQFCWFS